MFYQWAVCLSVLSAIQGSSGCSPTSFPRCIMLPCWEPQVSRPHAELKMLWRLTARVSMHNTLQSVPSNSLRTTTGYVRHHFLPFRFYNLVKMSILLYPSASIKQNWIWPSASMYLERKRQPATAWMPLRDAPSCWIYESWYWKFLK